jgi:hypothetical protein
VFGPAFGGAHGEDHVAGAKVWAKGVAGRQALARAPGVRAANAVGVFTTFDVPGAGTGGAQGTSPRAINPEGAITGWYADSNYGYHGFLRAAGGVFATFDAPGAVNGTIPASINPNGTIAGYFYDANFVDHGFVRTPGGGVATFNGTQANAINAQGAIAGTYFDANFGLHGFVRYTDGAISAFDAPGANTTGFPYGTQAVAIGPNGTIVGTYTDANFINHGFLRASNGTFTTFDPPGQIQVFAPYSFGPDLYIDENGVITEPISRSSRETRSAVITGSSSGPATAPLPHSTRRLRPAAYGRSLPASTRRKRSQGPSTTVTRSIMASCAPATAPSQPSTLRARAQEAPRPSASPEGSDHGRIH